MDSSIDFVVMVFPLCQSRYVFSDYRRPVSIVILNPMLRLTLGL